MGLLKVPCVFSYFLPLSDPDPAPPPLQVLMVGAQDFTLLGRPLLGRELVRVEATIIEKTESWPKVQMRFWKRHRHQRKRIIVQPQTVLRINSIELAPALK